jgi:PPOX class probable F420-dependent enzyme
VLVTSKRDGNPQVSPVTGGVDEQGRIVISTYPERAKTANARRDPNVTVLVLSDEFNDAWVQVSGRCGVIDPPDSVEPLVDYFRSISAQGSTPTGTSTARRCVTRASHCCESRRSTGRRSRPGASRRASWASRYM